ncbi:hypothetical protein [Salinibacter ruber]|uniref:hypothetical protein n=1 Tax=Salinibacter ruber TaxID=146919 RepID=UPI00207348F1|nr:hypothetical protein [Salinibacter ruber]
MKTVSFTRIDSEWLSGKPDIYAGKWCGRNLNGTVEEMKLSKKELRSRCEKCEKVYENLMPKVKEILNKINETDESLRYWKLVAGYFVKLQISFLLDRYYRAKKIKEKYGECEAFGLKSKSYKTFVGGRSFKIGAMFSDHVNLQLFTLVSRAAGINVEKVSYTDKSQKKSIKNKLLGIKRNISNKIKGRLKKVRSDVIFTTHYQNKKDINKISRYGGFVGEKLESRYERPNKKFRSRSRKKLKVDCESKINNMVMNAMIWNMPTSFIEHYRDIKSVVNKKMSRVPSVFCRSNPGKSPVNNIWIAECMKKGTSISTVQHGCGYGETKYSMNEKLERETSDVYFAWGWGEKDDCINVPSSRLERLQNDFSRHPKKHDPKKILWATRDVRFFDDNIYPLRIGSQLNLGYRDEHLEKVSSFSENLSDCAADLTTLRFKPYRSEYLNKNKYFKKRILKTLSKVSSYKASGDIKDDLKESALVVIDHYPSTLFLECLSLGIPVVAFDKRIMYNSRKKYRPLIEQMIHDGTLFNSADKAAEFVNSLVVGGDISIDKIENKSNTSTLNRYKNKFAKTSDSYYSDWGNVLKYVINRNNA